MRIAVLAPVFPRSSETPFTNILTGLVRRGHQVDVFAERAQPGTAPHPSIFETGLDARTWHRSPASGWRDAVRRVRARRDAPWLWRTLDPVRHGSRALKGQLLAAAEPFAGRAPYDVVYAAFGEEGRLALRLRRAGAFRAPIVTAFRGADITERPRRFGARYYRELFRQGALFLPVCQAFAERLALLGAPGERVRVHPTGLDVRRFTWRARRPGHDDGMTWLVGAARLTPKKGLADTLRAVQLLRAAGHDVRYRLLGRGPEQAALEQLARELGIADAVELLGHRGDAEVRAVMAASDIAVMASVTLPTGNAEGIPNVLKEAMLLGLPVVGTRHSGIPELVEHGVTGYLVPEREPAAIAAAVERLIAERARWPEMGAAGRRVVERDYDIEVLNDRLEGMLGEVVRSEK